jgi:PAS domain S-box-containing protein
VTERTILLVEDEGIVAKDVQKRLIGLGYGLAGWATSGDDAIAMAAESRPDLVLMDIRLRGEMDGAEAAEHIRSRFDIPVVFLTAYSDEETLSRVKISHPIGFILKPFSERDLHVAIEIALHAHDLHKALNDSEKRLAITLKSIGEAVIAVDADGVMTFMNPIAEALTGWSREDAGERRVDEVLSFVDGSGAAVENPALQALRDGSSVGLGEERVLVSRDGGFIPVSGAIAPIPDERGDPSGAVVVCRDISARKAAQAKLERLLSDLSESNRRLADQRAFLRAVFDSIPSSIMVVNEEYGIESFNRHLEQTLASHGAEPPVFVGEALRCTHALENPGRCGSLEECLGCRVRRLILGALGGESSQRQRCQLESRDNGHARSLTVQVVATPLDLEGKRMAIIVLDDITELNGLRHLLKTETSSYGIVGRSPGMQEVYALIRQVAAFNIPVLILGETGTGKELVANAIHNESDRSGKSFVTVNCGALPGGLIESELFGHVKGAFTGAVRDRKGRFELADGGTIFLDEVGELDLAMQSKLLRVLQGPQRHQQESVGRDPGRPLSRGPLLPPVRGADRSSSAAGAQERHSSDRGTSPRNGGRRHGAGGPLPVGRGAVPAH